MSSHSNRNQPVILVVDDNPVLLSSIERLLRMEGYYVLLAQTGETALSRLGMAQPRPDLIISDIAMPGMDGFELFESVRQRSEWLDIPFLFLTARDQTEDLRRGYTLGADDYLVKPFDQERLLLVIESKLKRRAVLQEHLQMQQHALDHVKRDLSMMVAHELRTPLVSISMVADILSQEIDEMGEAQRREMLDTMQGGSMRLFRLVEQMVMYVQLQSGALTQALQQYVHPCAARDLILGGVERARRFAPRAHEVSVCTEDDSLGLVVQGDPGSLQHALAELVLNAVAFSPADRSVLVRGWARDNRLFVSVTDYGPGIPPDELPHVLRPYYQVNRRKYEQQGIGIGLTLVQGIVDAHGGTFSLRSVVGRGTQAVVMLPAWAEG